MKLFGNHTISKLLIFILALQILNISIDAPFSQLRQHNINNQDFNYIDTYVEYFAEVILKYENAIPETKNRQHKELQQHNHVIIIFQQYEQITAAILFDEISNTQRLNYNDMYAYQFIKEINPPPPKVS